jgi:hypothetical protein
MIYPDFAQSQALYLVRAGAPVDRGHKALPDTLNKLSLRKGLLLLLALDRSNYLLGSEC